MATSQNPVYYAPSVFLNHGGGPNPVLGEKNNLEIAESLKSVPKYVDLKRVKAVIVVTAHREEEVVTISSGKQHSLVYDYNNFPPESYKFKHNASGDPELARRIHEAFKSEGIRSELDRERGWDHGVFIPMMLINPEANIPIVQVSILKNQNAAQHFEIGKVLRKFREEGVAVFGSGMSYHNMDEFKRSKIVNDGVIVNESFDKFITEVCTGDLKGRERILSWDLATGGLEAHPLGEADHFMPLIVCLGAAGKHPCKKVFDSVFARKFKLSGYFWGVE